MERCGARCCRSRRSNVHVAARRRDGRSSGFRVAYTPGHASHHVCLPARGQRPRVRRRRGRRADPAGGPDARADAAARHRRRGVGALARRDRRRGSRTSLGLTHFGAVDEVGRAAATRCATSLHELGAAGARRRTRRPSRPRVRDARRRDAATPRCAPRTRRPCRPSTSAQGLERYWRKRAERERAHGVARARRR